MNMGRARQALFVIGMSVVVLVLIFPPFAVIDLAGARHAPLGHHPFWRPPTPEMAEQVLTWRFGPPPIGARPSLRIRVNQVRLTFEVMVTVVCGLGAWATLGWREKRKRSRANVKRGIA